jgi:hypothetical protein
MARGFDIYMEMKPCHIFTTFLSISWVRRKLYGCNAVGDTFPAFEEAQDMGK